MSDVVIKVENLSKQYRLGVINHGTLAKDLQAWWAKKRGKEDPNSRIEPSSQPSPLNKGEGADALSIFKGKGVGIGLNGEGFYALRDINFEVKQGEVLGIIGSNGAGKSTLLKILSRVTSPTSGSIKIKGRIGSLLEVGTGFHPELTGRENIYLNGAILGMKRWEIDRKLDEIIDFSGVEKFIDTPVKRYSSGMYVRLAFAVAAHLDPEILVVDEVLAVGDAEFQKKCLGKMDDVSKKEGRTVLFVSHNMDAVNTICKRSIILSDGTIYYDGSVSEGISKYLSFNTTNSKTIVSSLLKKNQQRFGTQKKGEILSVSTINEMGDVVDKYDFGQKFGVLLKIKVNEKLLTPDVGICITNRKGHRISHLCTEWDSPLPELKPGIYVLKVFLDKLMIYPEEYLINCWLRAHPAESSEDFLDSALKFKVFQSKEYSMDFSRTTTGGIYLHSLWSCDRES